MFVSFYFCLLIKHKPRPAQPIAMAHVWLTKRHAKQTVDEIQCTAQQLSHTKAVVMGFPCSFLRLCHPYLQCIHAVTHSATYICNLAHTRSCTSGKHSLLDGCERTSWILSFLTPAPGKGRVGGSDRMKGGIFYVSGAQDSRRFCLWKRSEQFPFTSLQTNGFISLERTTCTAHTLARGNYWLLTREG